jgi:hypothetical protein
VYAVRSGPASKRCWTSLNDESKATVTVGRTLAGFDVLCSLCEHRGLDLCTFSDGSLCLTCCRCGMSEHINRVSSPHIADTRARDADG